MKNIVVYKSKYGATRQYAQWIGEELDCKVADAKQLSVEDLMEYDTIIYGGGLYAEVIDGVRLITKNFDRLKEKNLVVFSTGITPLECKEYYEKMVVEKNFKPEMQTAVKTFYFMGKMILSELSVVHRTAIKALKKLMASKENPTEMEKLLVELCDADGDFTNRDSVYPLVEYVKAI